MLVVVVTACLQRLWEAGSLFSTNSVLDSPNIAKTFDLSEEIGPSYRCRFVSGLIGLFKVIYELCSDIPVYAFLFYLRGRLW